MELVDALMQETTTMTTFNLKAARLGRIDRGGGGWGDPLALPGDIEKERAEARRAVQLSYAVIPHILLSYQGVVVPVPSSQREAFGRYASQVLPPQLEWYGASLRILLNFLAAVLDERNDPEPPLPPAASSYEGEGYVAAPLSCSGDAAPYLIDYAMEIDRDARSQSAAVSCFLSISFVV